MFDFHGWVVVEGTSDDEAVSPGVWEGIVERVRRIDPGEKYTALQQQNHLGFTMNANRNHAGQLPAQLRQLFAYVAEEATGSYGELYVLDAEKGDDSFTKWILKNGTVTELPDRDFSPLPGYVAIDGGQHDARDM